MKKIFFLFYISLCLPFVCLADTGSIDGIKDEIKNIAEIAQSEKPQEEKISSIKNITNEIFDWRLIGQYALAQNWKNFNTKEKEEFISVFSNLIFKTYFFRVKKDENDFELIFLNRIKKRETKATIKTIISRGKTKINIEYELIFKDKNWKIYNIKIESLSLVLNYRVQFNSFLKDKSPKDLIEVLKEKVEAFDV